MDWALETYGMHAGTAFVDRRLHLDQTGFKGVRTERGWN